MSKVQMLRALVKQRLTAAAEEIFGLFERTIAEYEEELCRSKEENERHQKLLDAVFNPQLQLNRADVQQLLVVKEEVPPEQQEKCSGRDQEDPEPPHIKEEQEHLWTSQEGEQLQGLEKADIIKFSFTHVLVKSEDDEEKPQSSQLQQRLTEQMETEAGREVCGGPESACNADPDTHLRPDTDEKTEDSSEPETDGDDLKETREPQLGLNSLNNDEVPDSRCGTGKRQYGCSECRKVFTYSGNLKRHKRVHTGEKPFSCSVCMKSFLQKVKFQLHMRIHKREERLNKKYTERLAQKCVHRTSWHHQTQTQVNRKAEPPVSSSNEQMETEADGVDCGGTEPARNSDPDRYLQPDTDDKTGDCCDPETDDSDDWKESRPYSTDVQQLLVKEVVLPEQQERSSSQPPHIKEEQEDLWTSQEREQHQGLEEADIKFPFASACVKNEDDEEKPHLHQRLAEGGGPEPARNSDPDAHLQPETDDSDDWMETRESQSGLKNLSKNNDVRVSDSRRGTGEKPFSCSHCVKTFATSQRLTRHMKFHTEGKPFGCSLCQKFFRKCKDLQKHIKIHTGEKRFSCSLCKNKFDQLRQLKRHMCMRRWPSKARQTPASSSVEQKKNDGEDSAHLHQDTDDKTEDSSEPETDAGDDSDV